MDLHTLILISTGVCWANNLSNHKISHLVYLEQIELIPEKTSRTTFPCFIRKLQLQNVSQIRNYPKLGRIKKCFSVYMINFSSSQHWLCTKKTLKIYQLLSIYPTGNFRVGYQTKPATFSGHDSTNNQKLWIKSIPNWAEHRLDVSEKCDMFIIVCYMLDQENSITVSWKPILMKKHQKLRSGLARYLENRSRNRSGGLAKLL